MLRKCIDAAPCRYYQTVKEFLASASTPEPDLANQKQDCKNNTVADEGTAHDEVRQALTQVIPLTEPQGCNAPEQHLHPADYRQYFPNCSVPHDGVSTYSNMYPFLQMQLQIDAEYALDEEHEHQERCERSVDVMGKLATTVGMAEEVADY